MLAITNEYLFAILCIFGALLSLGAIVIIIARIICWRATMAVQRALKSVDLWSQKCQKKQESMLSDITDDQIAECREMQQTEKEYRRQYLGEFTDD